MTRRAMRQLGLPWAFLQAFLPSFDAPRQVNEQTPRHALLGVACLVGDALGTLLGGRRTVRGCAAACPTCVADLKLAKIHP